MIPCADFRNHLFLDAASLAEIEGIEFRVHPPRAEGVVLSPEREWEAYRVAPLAVIADGGVYKLWYSAIACHPGVEHPLSCQRCRRENPGSAVHPLVSDEAGPVRHIHGSWLTGPDGQPTVLLINDQLTETQRVELALPAGCEVAAWSWLIKDAVRISEQPCTLADDGEGRLVAELAPMSLNAWTPEVRLTPLKGT